MNVFNLKKGNWCFFDIKPVRKTSRCFDSTFKIVNGSILVVVDRAQKLIDLYDLGSDNITSTRRHIDLECDLEDGLFLKSIENMEAVDTIENLLVVEQKGKGYALITCK